MADLPAGGGKRRVRGAFRAVVQGCIWSAAAPLPADAPHRAGQGAASRHRSANHRGRLPDRMEQPRHLRAHLPRHHGREPDRAARARAGGRAQAGRCAALLREGGPSPRPQDSSFGEAQTRRQRYPGRTKGKGGPMTQGIGVAGIYVHDQDEALSFYVDKLGFKVHTDARNGDYRWLTVQHPDQPSFQLGLFVPQAPVVDEETAQTLNVAVAKGAMPPLVLVVDNCRAAYDEMRKRGVEFTQEPTERFGNVDASFRDPSGNGWKMLQASKH